MKNLFILGSPRKDGNSTAMAENVARGLATTPGNSIEYIYLNSLTIQPCQGCGGCDKTGKCILIDDMQNLYAITDEADRIFFVSPVYFYSVSAQLKAYIDRCQAFWARKYLLHAHSSQQSMRTGYLLSCAATNGTQLFTGAELIIQCLCDTMDIQYGYPLLISNVDQKDAIKNDSELLARCSTFGKTLVTDKEQEQTTS